MVRDGRDLCGSSSPTPLPKQGHPEQAAQDRVQAGLAGVISSQKAHFQVQSAGAVLLTGLLPVSMFLTGLRWPRVQQILRCLTSAELFLRVTSVGLGQFMVCQWVASTMFLPYLVA